LIDFTLIILSNFGYREADVVVAGGGTGGSVAAIAAARNGMDVLVVERQGFLGGMLTDGNMCVSSARPWTGIGKEIFDRLFEEGAAKMHPDDPPNYPIFHQRSHSVRTVPYDPEVAKNVLFEMCEEAGVRLLLHTFITGVVTEGGKLRGITVANKSGSQVAMGKILCDGTGDGDVASAAGAEYVKGYGPDKRMFALTMLVRLSNVDWHKVSEYSMMDKAWSDAIRTAMRCGELPYYRPRTVDMVLYWGHERPELSRLWYDDGALLWGGTVEDVDGTDVDALTYAEVECRKQWKSELGFLRQYIPGFEKSRVEHTSYVGVRDTRHVVGVYTYTADDFLNQREFPDTVAYAVPYALGVPYRCLLPKKIDNLLIASRCISVTPGQIVSGPEQGAYNHLKSMTSCMTYGQAAGTAAALCVKKEVKPRHLDVSELQRTLSEQEALVEPEVLLQIRGRYRYDLGDLFSYSDNRSIDRT